MADREPRSEDAKPGVPPPPVRVSLGEAYAGALQRYMATGDAAVLDEADEIGRRLLREERALFTISAAHHAVLASLTGPGRPSAAEVRAAERFQTAVMETADRGIADQISLSQELYQEVMDRRRSMKALEKEAELLSENRDWMSFELSARQSELTRRESELARTAAALRTQEQQQTALIYAISHELKAPLTSITALIRAFREDHAGEDLDLSDIDLAAGSSLRLAELLDALVLYCRLAENNARPERVDLTDIVDAVLAEAAPEIDRTGAIVERSALPTVWAVDFQMSVLFRSLIGNALKFRDPERRLRIGIHDTSPLSVSQVRVTVSDNGIGIDPDFADRVFGMFTRLHVQKDYRGSGVGLALCKRIIERHRGQIAARPGIDQGSAIDIVLPLDERRDLSGPDV